MGNGIADSGLDLGFAVLGFGIWDLGFGFFQQETRMIRRVLASVAVAAVIAIIATLPVQGQGSGAVAPPLVITAFNGGPEPANWTPPKTPWGEPDLQGTWSSDDASFGVSRGGRGAPAGAAPQGLYLNDEQWAARQKQIQDGVV